MTPETQLNRSDFPDTQHPDFVAMERHWVITQALYAGTSEAKEAGLLNQMEGELDAGFKTRKKEAELFSLFASQIAGVVGLVFSNDITPEEAPAQLEELFFDIDLCGNDLPMFLRETFTNAVRDGHSFILVDAPLSVSDGESVNLADVADRRPHWINYRANQIFNWNYEIIKGRAVLLGVTIQEISTEKEGRFGQKQVIKYRVIEKEDDDVLYSLYRYNEKGKTFAERFVPEFEKRSANGSGAPVITEIPLVPVYAKKTGFFTSKPPFLAIAEANVKHFNKLSMLDYILTFIKPKVVVKFDSKEDADKWDMKTMSVGAGIKIFGASADMKYLELAGTSIPELRTEIESIEKRVGKMGLEKFAPVEDGQTKTAFEVGSDNRKEMSEIAVMAQNLENGAEIAFYYTALQLQNIRSAQSVNIPEEDARLKLNIQYDRLTFSLDQLRFFAEEREKGAFSAQTYFQILARYADMPKDWTPEVEMERLANEGGVILENARIGDEL